MSASEKSQWTEEKVDGLLSSFFQNEMPEDIRQLPATSTAGRPADGPIVQPATVETGREPSRATSIVAVATVAGVLLAVTGVMLVSPGGDPGMTGTSPTTVPDQLVPNVDPHDGRLINVGKGNPSDDNSDYPDASSEFGVPEESESDSDDDGDKKDGKDKK